jgi:GNAT superfamily N-acetyltransferase
MAACVAELGRGGAARQYADGRLPAPGVYGVPDQWPHVQQAYTAAGFVHQGRIESVFIAAVGDLATGKVSIDGAVLRRSLGVNGTRLSAVRGDEELGYVEVETLEDGGRVAQHRGLADIGNFHVAENHHGDELETWLLEQAADWLRLAGVERVLAYSEPGEDAWTAFLLRAGFREVTRTKRGWVRPT